MRRSLCLGWLAPILVLAGCRSLPTYTENPITVTGEWEEVWNTTVGVLEKYFDVSYENRYDGRIETHPQTGSTLLEFWQPDAVDFRERLEGTLQTIRRRAFVLIQPVWPEGFAISIEVYKELEDLPRPAFAKLAGGTFLPSIQPVRETVVESPIEPSAGWINLGRDHKLEARILDDLCEAVDGLSAWSGFPELPPE